MIAGAIRTGLKNCGRTPDVREKLSRSVSEGILESRHSIKSLDAIGSMSHDIRAELRMHSLTMACDTFSNEEKVAEVVQVISVEDEITGRQGMLALGLSTLMA